MAIILQDVAVPNNYLNIIRYIFNEKAIPNLFLSNALAVNSKRKFSE